LLWHPSYPPLRKTERFKAFVRATDYVEYWHVKGWPEFCHPTTADVSSAPERPGSARATQRDFEPTEIQ